jgi:hypothetical protein
VEPSPVVSRFDKFKDLAAQTVLAPLRALAQRLAFERAPERFHGRVVVAVAFSAHAGDQAGALQLLAVKQAGVLHAPIRMMNDAARMAPLLQGPRQGLQRPAGFQVLPERPAQDLAAIKVHHRRQKQPPLRGGDVRDVGDPNLIGFGRGRPIQQQVGRNRLVMVAVGGAHFARASAAAFEAVLPHQSLHPLMVANLPLGAQGLGDARAAVRAPVLLESLPNLRQKQLIALGPRARPAFAPRVIAAAGHAQKRAQISHRFFPGKLANHLAADFYTSEMMPKVFFRISR